jgi:hypothetical protein
MPHPSTSRRHGRNRKALREFEHPPGTRVRVRRDRGDVLETVTESYAFLLDGCLAMIVVEGIPGNTRLDRVEVVP